MLTHALYGSPVPRRAHGFEQNSLNGILLHSLARWNALILENMTNYVRGVQTFRRTCNPNLEMSKWMQEGMAEVISPWMHFVLCAEPWRGFTYALTRASRHSRSTRTTSPATPQALRC